MSEPQIVSAVVTEDPRPLLTELMRLLLDTREYTLKLAHRHLDEMDDDEAFSLSARALEIGARVQKFSASMRDGAVS